MQSRGFLSWSSLFVDTPPDTKWKLASVWFDQVVLQVPGGRGTLDSVIDGLRREGAIDSEAAEELRKCWIPVGELIPGYNAGDRMTSVWNDANPMLVSEAEVVVMKEIRMQGEALERDAPGLFRYEVARTGAARIWAVRDWCDLNSIEPCSFLADDAEDSIARKVFQYAAPKDVETFSSVASARIPDMSELSWGKVVELRMHPNLQAFRRHLGGVQQTIEASPNVDRTALVQSLEIDALREFAVAAKPSVRMSTLKAIVGNFPMPLPINPASVAIGMADVARDVKLAKKFGWLYF